MYQPPIFREDRIDVIHDLINSHPFATLVTTNDGEIAIDHLPLVLHEKEGANGVIRGHIARANPLKQNAGKAVAIFQGPQAYISPSWYPSKKQHGKAVPTWNYAVVHARSDLNIIDDPDWLMKHLVDLTTRHEGHRATAWQVSDAPTSYIEGQLRGLVGVELTVQSLEGKWKVSQNKDEQDREGVSQGLQRERTANTTAVAELVSQKR